MAPSSIDVLKPVVAPPVAAPVVHSKPIESEEHQVEERPEPVKRTNTTVSEADLEKIAKDIEKAFGSTKVTFEGADSGSANKIKFSVVNEKTGEVVFRFPLEAGQSAQQHIADKDSKGILLTSKA